MKYLCTGTKLLIILYFNFYSFPGFSQKSKSQISDLMSKSYDLAEDNSVIKKGEIKSSGQDQNLLNLTIDEGVLVITGKVKIKKLAINKGTIIITKSGKATLPSMDLNGNVSIINYGSVIYTGNVKTHNSNNKIVNETSDSRMNWGSSQLDLGGKKSVFINNGNADIGMLILNSKNGKVLLGPNSLTNVVDMENNYTNRIFIPSGVAKLSQAGLANLPKALTNSSNLIICPGPTSEIRKSDAVFSGYGNANVMEKGCTSFPKFANQTLTSYK